MVLRRELRQRTGPLFVHDECNPRRDVESVVPAEPAVARLSHAHDVHMGPQLLQCWCPEPGHVERRVCYELPAYGGRWRSTPL